ncbi:MAG TPA: type II toxin-antitoxin system HicB family antitoxin [Rugosimonospora sp.]|nr:type II toxin-antitoxin system HicB family antitoxin [Rugosimonospora sp.]
MITINDKALAGLVAHALNQLDGWDHPQDDHGCCPYCCAPCASLKALDEAGQLDDAVRPIADGYVWWDSDTGAVDRGWMARAWRETDCHSLMVVEVGGVEYDADVRDESFGFQAEARQLPGCFATGSTLDELREALTEAVRLWMEYPVVPQ